MKDWLRQRLWALLDAVAGTALLALLVLAWRGGLPEHVAGMRTLYLLILCGLGVAGLSILAWRVHLRLASEEQLRQLCPAFRDRAGHLAMDPFLAQDRDAIDRSHHLEELIIDTIVDGTDDIFRIRYRGHNDSRRLSRHFKELLVGDAPADYSRLQLRVIDKRRRQPLYCQPISDRPYRKLLMIAYAQPLSSGEEFDIEIAGRWPSNFTRQHDYVFYPVNTFRRGVTKLTTRLAFSVPPVTLAAIHVLRPGRIELTASPRVREKPNRYELSWQISNPVGMYLLCFERSDIRDENGSISWDH